MAGPKERYVVDKDGNRIEVVLEIGEYRSLLEAAEELEAIRAFDSAKASQESPVPFDQAVREIERSRR